MMNVLIHFAGHLNAQDTVAWREPLVDRKDIIFFACLISNDDLVEAPIDADRRQSIRFHGYAAQLQHAERTAKFNLKRVPLAAFEQIEIARNGLFHGPESTFTVFAFKI